MTVPDQIVLKEQAAQAAVSSAQRAMRVATFALIVVYVAPLIIITYSFLTTGYFNRQDWGLLFFIGLSTSTDDSLGLVHRTLLPLIGGFAPLAFRDSSTARSTTGLIVFLIVGISLSIFLSAVVNTDTVRQHMSTLSLFDNLLKGSNGAESNLDAGMKLIQSFFARTQEALGMYLLLLFGLKLEKAVP